MKPMSLASPEAIASEYGGNKKAIANAARMGLVDPSVALMAGMFIDRMRNAAIEEQKPDTTVAQDVFGGPMQQRQTPQQPQPQPQGIPAAQMAAAQPPQMAQAPAGIEALPAGDVGNYSMAGGGIVAFGDGGDVPGYAGTNGSLVGGLTDAQAMSLGFPNAQAYYAAQAKTMQDTFSAQGRPDSPVFVNRQAPANPNLNAFGLPRPDPAANLALATQQAKNLVTVPDELTQQKAIENKEALDREVGFNPNIYQEHKDIIGQDREKLKTDREEAKDFAIFEAGLGIMSGESPHAMVNIGKGSTPAMKNLAQTIKDIKKDDRELSRAQMALDTAENAYKLDKSKSVENRVEKNQERRDHALVARANTAAQLGSSLNTLAGSQYSADTGAASAKQTAEISERAQRFSAEKGLEGHLASAAATRYASDHEDRQIEKLMKSNPNLTRTDAIREIGSAKNPKDQYNALSLRFSKARAEVAADPTINTAKVNLAKLISDKVPRTDPQYKVLEDQITSATAKIMSDNWIDETSHKLIRSLEGNTASRAGAPNTTTPATEAAAAPTAGKYSTVAPDGRTYSFDTPQQLQAFKDRLARLAKEDKKGQ